MNLSKSSHKDIQVSCKEAARQFNNSLTVADLTRQEEFYPSQMSLLSYSKPHDSCHGLELHLGNQAGGFPFTAIGHVWKGVEFLYLCGEWSCNTQEHLEVQEDVLTAKSGYAAKRYKKNKHKKKIRPDFSSFRIQWMLWCIWQKCLNSKEFQEHLLSIPDDYVIVEYVKNDTIWAAYSDEDGVIRGGNAVPKILTICRRCLREGSTPKIDTDLLNRSNIYILGEKVNF